MKRVLILALTLMVVSSIFVVSVMATGDTIYGVTDTSIECATFQLANKLTGDYNLRITFSDVLYFDIPVTFDDSGQYSGIYYSDEYNKYDIYCAYNSDTQVLSCIVFHDEFVEDFWIGARFLSGEYSLTPVSSDAPSLGFMESIGYFFSSCIGWLSQVASLIVSNPVLLVISVGIILVTFSVLIYKRF